MQMSCTVEFTLNVHDPYYDLQMAVLESQLEDAYDHAHVEVQQHVWDPQVTVRIHFSCVEDLVHWQLTHDESNHLNTIQWQNTLSYQNYWKVAGQPQSHSKPK
jgi:hypothetical protein